MVLVFHVVSSVEELHCLGFILGKILVYQSGCGVALCGWKRESVP